MTIPHFANQRNNRYAPKIPGSAVLAFAVDKLPAFCRQRSCRHRLFLECIRLHENELCDTSQLILTNFFDGVEVNHKSIGQVVAICFQVCHAHILCIALRLIHNDISNALQLRTAGSLLHKVLDAGAQEVNVLTEGFPQLRACAAPVTHSQCFEDWRYMSINAGRKIIKVVRQLAPHAVLSCILTRVLG